MRPLFDAMASVGLLGLIYSFHNMSQMVGSYERQEVDWKGLQVGIDQTSACFFLSSLCLVTGYIWGEWDRGIPIRDRLFRFRIADPEIRINSCTPPNGVKLVSA